MIEYHDHHGDEHDHVTPAGADAPDDHVADSFTEHHPPPPLADLPAHADAPADLHFPGEEVVHPAPAADLDPSAPWLDDAGFAQWLGGHEADPSADASPAGDGLADQFPQAPDGAGGLPSSDQLVDWTLRQLGAEDQPG